jgi:outer membrane biosynthesis protein TonB
VSTGRAAAEAEAVLAALAAARDAGHPAVAVELARAAAPVFAAALAWSAWERALRAGLDAARQSGSVAEEAYFQHELGVLALCTDDLERARTELEASLALRGALADRHGSTVGRRTLALVADRQGEPAPGSSGAEATATAVFGALDRTPSGGIPRVRAAVAAAATAAAKGARGGRRGIPPAPRGKRRPLVIAGAGVLLVAAVGTAVAMGTSGSGGTPHHDGTSSTSRPADGTAADGDPTPAATGSAPAPSASPSGSPSVSPSPSGSEAPLGQSSESPSASASESTSPSTSPSPSPSKKATKSPTAKPTKSHKPGSSGGSSGGSSSTGGSSTTGGGSSSTTGSTSTGTSSGGANGSTTTGSSSGSSSTGGSSTTDGSTTGGDTGGSTTTGSTTGTTTG